MSVVTEAESRSLVAAKSEFPLQVKAKEAARLLQMSERRLGSLSRSGQIPSYKVGATRYYSVDALRAWVNQQSVAAASRAKRRMDSRVEFALRIAG